MEVNRIAILFDRTKQPQEIEEHHINMIKELNPNAQIFRAQSEDELLSLTNDADVLLTWRNFSPVKFCKIAKNLKWIHTLSAGVDGIVVPEILNSNIKITSTKEIHGLPMAEHAMAFILSFLRLLPTMFRQQEKKIWKKHLTADETHGKTVGIIGLGSIGLEIAKKCSAFGMRVVAVKRTKIKSKWVDCVYSKDELGTMLSESDFVIVIVPLTSETHNLIGIEEFKLMKKNAYIINLARGPIINEDALICALKEGIIAGAGLDVFAEEPLPPDNLLWEMPNVIITPHMAADSSFYMDRAIHVFCENLKRFTDGQPLKFEVSKKLGY